MPRNGGAPKTPAGQLRDAIRKRNPRKPGPAREPRAVEDRYRADLRRYTKNVNTIIGAILARILPKAAKQAGLRLDATWQSLLRAAFRAIQTQIDALEPELRRAVNNAALDTAAFNRAETARVMRRIVGIDIFADSLELLSLARQWENESVSKIVTTTSDNFKTIEDTVFEGFRAGRRASSISKDIQARMDVLDTRADFWAVDQIGTLNGKLTQQRQTTLGLDEYIWRTSRDERVRQTHRNLEGTTHRWDDPPTVGERQVHPGEDYRCRCTAEPVVPGVTNIETGPADVPRNPKLVARARARARLARQRRRAREPDE